MRRTSTAVLALSILLSGCRLIEGTSPDLPPSAVSVPIDTLLQALNSGALAPKRWVIRDQAIWGQVWTELTDNEQTAREAPAVDFSTGTVVAAAMGQLMIGGHSIHIEGVYEAEGRLYVVVRSRGPGRTCPVLTVVTQPVSAVYVPRRSDAVVFVERHSTSECS